MKPNSTEEYTILLEYTKTDKQKETLEKLIEHGSARAYAETENKSRSTIRSHLEAVRKTASRKGFSARTGWDYHAPDGFMIKGVSDMRTNEEGKPVWYKTDVDKERQWEIMQEQVNRLVDSLPPRPMILSPKSQPEELLNLYTFSDYHLGMLAWHKEGGADWDLDIACKMLYDSFQIMMNGARPAKYGFINLLGDFMHYDKMESVTNQSGHVLDADSRFQKMQDAAFDCIEGMIQKALEKHEKVIFLGAEGNHDELSGGYYIPTFIRRLYRDNPRLEVISSYTPYYAYLHGETSLFFHHGHKRKLSDLGGIFPAMFREIWGKSRKSYGHTGHLHHVDTKETNGILMMQHPTLAAADAYAARGGWISDRKAICQTYHKKHGLVGENHVTPEMVDVEDHIETRRSLSGVDMFLDDGE